MANLLDGLLPDYGQTFQGKPAPNALPTLDKLSVTSVAPEQFSAPQEPAKSPFSIDPKSAKKAATNAASTGVTTDAGYEDRANALAAGMNFDEGPNDNGKSPMTPAQYGAGYSAAMAQQAPGSGNIIPSQYAATGGAVPLQTFMAAPAPVAEGGAPVDLTLQGMMSDKNNKLDIKSVAPEHIELALKKFAKPRSNGAIELEKMSSHMKAFGK